MENNMYSRLRIHEKNVDIFKETIVRYSTDADLVKSIENSVESAIVFDTDYPYDIPTLKDSKKYDTCIQVTNSTVISIGYGLGAGTCIMNFADGFVGGGAVTRGSNAQEECICRCSTLYPITQSERLQKEVYEVHRNIKNNVLRTNMGFYTDISVFRLDKGEYDFVPTLKMGVITVAAPDLRYGKEYDPEDPVIVENIERKIRATLRIAIAQRRKNIVLGAFGCGAFLNSPFVVASLFQKVLNDEYFDGIKYYEKFENIIFAIRKSDGIDESNYLAFLSTEWKL